MKNVRISAGFRVAAGLAAVALPFAAAGTAFADPPGDNGTVKIHNTGTPQPDRENQPQVCTFYLDAFGFDTLQSVHWEIDTQAPTKPQGSKAAAGDITLKNGAGATAAIALPDGHYKLFWTFAGEHGDAKQKVFWVHCDTTPPTSSSSSSPSSPGHSSSSISGSSSGGTTGGTGGTGTTGGTGGTGTTGGTGGTGTTGGSTGGATTPKPSATTPGAPTTTSPSTGNLAHTGANGSVLYIAAGALALGGGGFALRRFAMARSKG